MVKPKRYLFPWARSTEHIVAPTGSRCLQQWIDIEATHWFRLIYPWFINHYQPSSINYIYVYIIIYIYYIISHFHPCFLFPPLLWSPSNFSRMAKRMLSFSRSSKVWSKKSCSNALKVAAAPDDDDDDGMATTWRTKRFTNSRRRRPSFGMGAMEEKKHGSWRWDFLGKLFYSWIEHGYSMTPQEFVG